MSVGNLFTVSIETNNSLGIESVINCFREDVSFHAKTSLSDFKLHISMVGICSFTIMRRTTESHKPTLYITLYEVETSRDGKGAI